MKCIILCAGFATRLYPLTKNKPKPLLEVGNKTILDRIMDKIEKVRSIDEVYIVSNDVFSTQFKNWNNKQNRSKRIHILNDGVKNNEERLGTVGDLHFTMQETKINDDILIVGGDNLFEFDINAFIAYFKKKNASIIALYDLKDPAKLAKKFGVAIVDKNQKIIDFQEKPEHPKSSLAATLCYILKKESLLKLPDFLKECIRRSFEVPEFTQNSKHVKHHKGDNAGSFIEWLIKSENVYGFTFTEAWFDIGSHEALAEANNIYNTYVISR